MISAVVILYHPDLSINDNLRPLLAHTNRLFLVDNTEQSQRGMLHADIADHPRVHYLHTGTNEGIAQPLNRVCQLTLQQGDFFLLTMDQDSCFSEEMLQQYLVLVQNFPEAGTVGMFGVNHLEQSSRPASSSYEAVARLITSGSILNLRHFHQIGPFNEQLFIDHVDSEYCFRILMAGFKNVLFTGIYLQHPIGVASQQVSLRTFKTTFRSLHSPLRLYYMVRNLLYLSRQYKPFFPVEIQWIRKDTLNRIKNNLLYGKDRLKRIRYLLRAVADFRNGVMGKIRT